MKYYINRFKEIAAKEQGTFYFSDEGLLVGWGVRSPQATFQLEVPYKGHVIYISNKVGNQFTGKCICKLPLGLKAPDFTIKTKSHLSTLFSFNKKNRFKIDSKHKKLITYLKKNDSIKVLNQVAKNDIFEPTIYGKNTKTDYQLIIKYHLEFDNWTQVLQPIITFKKELIDVLEHKEYVVHSS